MRDTREIELKNKALGRKHKISRTYVNNYTEEQRSKRGLLRLLYDSQVRRSKEKGWDKPDYTLSDLREIYLTDRVFVRLHDKWIRSGLKLYLKPVFDRINCLKPYTLMNLEPMTHSQNSSKGATTDRSIKQRLAKIRWDAIS